MKKRDPTLKRLRRYYSSMARRNGDARARLRKELIESLLNEAVVVDGGGGTMEKPADSNRRLFKTFDVPK